jgi:hypothetical protein
MGEKMDRLNLFNPFMNKPVEYEDQLTWAFLVALRYDPLLQRYLREMVVGKLPVGRVDNSWSWEPATIETQTTRIPGEASFIVSVVVSDEPLKESVPVEWVDRDARYDGLVHYPDGLVLIIENKPKKGDIWTDQLSPSIASRGDDIPPETLYERAISLSWPDILEGLLRYAGSSSASHAGRQMVSDFLQYVADKKPNLSPYRTFRLCDGREEALKKRIRELMVDLAGKTGFDAKEKGGAAYLERPGKIAQEAHLAVTKKADGDLEITQSLWPADTVGQAREFYKVVDAERFFGLKEHDWWVKPHLHFAFMGTQLLWPKTKLSLQTYFEWFRSQPGKYGMKPIGEDRKLRELDEWIEEELISMADKEEVSRKFLQTKRNHINVIPGFGVMHSWNLNKLIELEESGELVDRLLEKFDEALASWGEKMGE